ncbi:MAG: YfcE family phosphodiesterase [Clostridia bacterium]|nr:YfcE family phosphodiesterase [Clostridia bacterium]
MKLAIISDTHGNVANFKKAINWVENNNITVVLHCGDIGSPESLKESLVDFSGMFFGVLGNMDSDFKDSLNRYNTIKNVKVLEVIFEKEIGNKKIAITHKPEEAKKMVEARKYDVVFYGHTHKPWRESINDCELVNPGELAGQIFRPSFAIYDTDSNLLELKILDRL